MAKRRKRSLFSILSVLVCLIVAFLTYSGGVSGILNSLWNATEFDKSSDFVRYFDVGQGDCALIYSNGRSALIDTGTTNSSNELCIELERMGITSIDVMMISHLHSDHTGGVLRLMDNFEVKNLILPELSTYSEGMSSAQNAINKISSSGGGVYNAVSGMNFNVGEFDVTVLAAYEADDENNRSIFAMAMIDGRKFLFGGDAEEKMEKLLLKESLNLDCDVFKLSHHGSSTSNSEDFLNAIKPEFAVISVGEGNSYGHPHKEVLSELNKRKIPIYRTDKSGDITFTVKSGKISVETEK